MAESPKEFNPYRRWLNIAPAETGNLYRLLDVDQFEDDLDAIEMGRNRRMAFLNTIKGGEHVADAERIKNEVHAAYVLLMKSDRKAAYDEQLRQQVAVEPEYLPSESDFYDEIFGEQLAAFRVAAVEVCSVGVFGRREGAYLREMQQKLGISQGEARGIFNEVRAEFQVKDEEMMRELEHVLLAKLDRQAACDEQLRQQHAQQVAVEPEYVLSYPDFDDDIFGEKLEAFRVAAVEVCSVGVFGHREGEYLREMQQKLGISQEDARGIFNEVRAEFHVNDDEMMRELARREVLSTSPWSEPPASIRPRPIAVNATRPPTPAPPPAEIHQHPPPLPDNPATENWNRSNRIEQNDQNPVSQGVHIDPDLTSREISTDPSHPADSDRLRIKSIVAKPAIVMMVGALLNMGMCIFVGIARLSAFISGERTPAGEILQIYVMFIGSFVVLTGSVSMYRLQDFTLSRWACGLSIVPLFGCFPFGMVFGVRGWTVLSQDDVKKAFQR